MDELKAINLIADESYALQPVEKSVFDAAQKYFFAKEALELEAELG